MRARNLKPSFFKNDLLGKLNPLARLLFQGLWCMSDRKGKLEFRPLRIKAEVLPFDNCDIELLLCDLTSAGFIHVYKINGNNFIKIPKFEEHQNPHIKERESTIPEPGKHGASTRQARCKTQPKPERARLNPESPLLNPESGILIADSGETPPPKKSEPKTRPRQFPEDFAVTAELRTWAVDGGVGDVDRETLAFADYHRAKGTVFRDWHAAWRTWMRNAVKFAGERHGKNFGNQGTSKAQQRENSNKRAISDWLAKAEADERANGGEGHGGSYDAFSESGSDPGQNFDLSPNPQ
jgi:hypothetical protein